MLRTVSENNLNPVDSAKNKYNSCEGNLPYYTTCIIVLRSLTLFDAIIDIKCGCFVLLENVIPQLKHVKCLILKVSVIS